MDDRFVYESRRDPSPEFATRLKERLDRQGPAHRAEGERLGFGATLARLSRRPVFAAAAVLGGLLVALVLFPSVRASAQAFLDLFRVRNFVALPVDPKRIEQLKDQKFDPKSLLGEPEFLREPKVTVVASAAEAQAVAGYAPRLPAFVPEGFAIDTMVVCGDAEARYRLDAARLNAALTALGITDLAVPANVQGAPIQLRTHESITIRYRKNQGGTDASREDAPRIVLAQAPSPELELPPGLDIPYLGEIGLRVAGLTPEEARRFARTIDWHTTLLVPVPANATEFREVTVRGHKALLIELSDAQAAGPQERGERGPGGKRRLHRGGSILLWSEPDRVFALQGERNDLDLVQMANSVQ